MKTIEELEAVWRAACDMRDAARASHDRTLAAEQEAFRAYMDAADIAADAFDALVDARQTALAEPKGDA